MISGIWTDAFTVVVKNQEREVAVGILGFENEKLFLKKIEVDETERKKGYGDFLIRLLIRRAFTIGEPLYVWTPSVYLSFFSRYAFLLEDSERKENILLKCIEDTDCQCGGAACGRQ